VISVNAAVRPDRAAGSAPARRSRVGAYTDVARRPGFVAKANSATTRIKQPLVTDRCVLIPTRGLPVLEEGGTLAINLPSAMPGSVPDVAVDKMAVPGPYRGFATTRKAGRNDHRSGA
jgi:hypothetical protein